MSASLQIWEESLLCQILGISLNDKVANVKGAIFDPRIVSEVTNDGPVTSLNDTVIDRIIVYVLLDSSNSLHQAYRFTWIVERYFNALSAFQSFTPPRIKNVSEEDLRNQVLGLIESAKTLLLSYANLLLTIPDCWNETLPSVSNQFVGLLENKGDLHVFLDALVNHVRSNESDEASANETLQNILTPILQVIHESSVEFQTRERALTSFMCLLQCRALVPYIVNSPIWMPPSPTPGSYTGQFMEKRTLLGPFFDHQVCIRCIYTSFTEMDTYYR